MRMLRCVLSVCLAILMISSMFSLFSVAADYDGKAAPTGSMDVTFSAQSTAAPGEVITVTVNIKNNYNATAIRIPILYSKKVFELVTTGGAVIQTAGPMNASNSKLTYSNQTDTTAFYTTAYRATEYNVLLVQWLGYQTAAGAINVYNQPSGYNCFTFQLKVKADPTASVGGILVPPSTGTYARNFYYQGVTTPGDASTMYTMTTANCPMTFVPANVNVNIIAPDIEPKTYSTNPTKRTIIEKYTAEYGASFEGVIYGFPDDIFLNEESMMYDYNSAIRYFNIVGNAKVVFTPMTEFVYGTKTKVDIYSSSNSYVKTYYLVLFGDIDGSGFLDGNDVSECEMAYKEMRPYAADWLDPQSRACDLASDTFIDAFDLANVYQLQSYIKTVSQTGNGTFKAN